MSVSEHTRLEANLRLLQRTCSPEITGIAVSATHVVLYEYKDTAWHKSGIEGSLFIVQRTRNNTLSHEMIVLNRHSTDNFQVDLTANFQVQHQEPYLIFKEQRKDQQQSPRIRGIWFHSDGERDIVYSVLQRTLQTIQQHEAAVAALAATSNNIPAAVAADAGAALVSLLSPMTVSAAGGTTSAPAPAVAAVPSTPSALSTGPPKNTVAASVHHHHLPQQNTAKAAPQPTNRSSSSNSSTSSSALPPDGVALDKKSLQLALLSLIQDDRFLDLLHSQYLRVVHARAAKGKGASHGNNNNNE